MLVDPANNPVLNGKSSESDSVPLNLIEIVPVVPDSVEASVTIVTEYFILVTIRILFGKKEKRRKKKKEKKKKKKEKRKKFYVHNNHQSK